MKVGVFLLFFLTSLVAFSQSASFVKNAELGKGINLGNMFEAPSEDAWGNPFQDDYLSLISTLGFEHVRIPVRWEPDERSLSTAPYTIQPEFMQRIQHTVDLALKNKLHAIINMHHHEALFENPDEQKARFLAMWNQIATYFSSYSDSLVFELLNEPHGNLTAAKWNTLLDDAVKTIRTTNPNRFILVGTAEYGGLGGLSQLQLPGDDHLILTIHYYNPFSFTHQGADWTGADADQWLGTEWLDTESERQTIQSEFASAVHYSETNNVPIHVGEFGAYSKADINSRVRWTTYLARYFESLGFSWAYWEFSAGFGIYDPSTQSFRQQLVDALLHTPMPAATPVNKTEIRKTDFEEDNNAQGWNLYNNNGASSSNFIENGRMTVVITDGGTESWHIQLALTNLYLEKGKNYEIKVRAKSTSERSMSVYTGMNRSPWSSYSGYTSVSLVPEFQTFTLSFHMQNATDSESRLVLDLGTSTKEVAIDEVALYEVEIATDVLERQEQSPYLFPNPSTNLVFISKADRNSTVRIYALTGKQLISQPFDENAPINIESLPDGQYLVQWQLNQSPFTKKLIKTH